MALAAQSSRGIWRERSATGAAGAHLHTKLNCCCCVCACFSHFASLKATSPSRKPQRLHTRTSAMRHRHYCNLKRLYTARPTNALYLKVLVSPAQANLGAATERARVEYRVGLESGSRCPCAGLPDLTNEEMRRNHDFKL